MARLNLLRTIKNPYKLIGCIVTFLCVLLYFIRTDIYWNEVNKPIDLMLTVLPYVFLLFMFLSFITFFDKKKYGINEIICLDFKEIFKDRAADFAVLVLFDLIFSGFVLFFQLICYEKVNVLDKSLTSYTIRVVVIYVFLSSLAAITFGWAASLCKRFIIGFICVFGIYFLFDTTFLSVLFFINPKSYNLWKFSTLFSFFYQSRRGICRDADYLLSAENVHIYRALFFIFLALTVIIAVEFKKVIASVITGLLSVLFLILFFMPTGAVYFMMDVYNTQDSVGYLDSYHDDSKFSTSMCEKSNDDFYVKKYDIDMKITDEVAAKITVTPSDTGLDEYQYTLHYLFKVNSVTSADGSELKYKQQGDYLTVYSEGKDMSKMTISYKGVTSYFYATSQGLFLPADYEYYPFPGYHKVFLCQNDEEEKKLGDTCFSRELLSNYALFNVKLKVKARYPVFSNYKGTKPVKAGRYNIWEFSGSGNGLTLIGNPYLKSYDVNGIRIICSKLDLDNVPEGKNADTYIDHFKDIYNKTGFSYKGKSFIVAPDSNYINYCYGDDHSVDTINNWKSEIIFRSTGKLYPGQISDIDPEPLNIQE
ncbi:MAG: hypothetical protein VZR23_02120 [Lachnospiraceae bacterium]|nr:hypothetical protein [Lachnospiraceae bacterium]